MSDQTWVDILRDYRIVGRFASAIFCVALCAFLLTWGIFWLLRRYEPITSVSFGGRAIVFANHDQHRQVGILTVPANEVWVDTGLDVQAGHLVTIKAWGSVNLSVRRLVLGAKEHRPPQLPWMNPNGADLSGRPDSSKQADRESREMLIDKRFWQGELLGYLKRPQEPPPGRFNPRPNSTDHEIFGIGLCHELGPEEHGRLFVVVNDDYVDEHQFEAVFLKYHDKNVTEQQRRADFKWIINHQYYEIYFNDNIGDFFVHISLDPKQQGCGRSENEPE